MAFYTSTNEQVNTRRENTSAATPGLIVSLCVVMLGSNTATHWNEILAEKDFPHVTSFSFVAERTADWLGERQVFVYWVQAQQ